jgi:phthalate 4,5-dioxygenase
VLDHETNEKMCRVGAGTPMGDALRHYWIPAISSDELVADGDPMPVDLLGETLVAFRNSEGQVGIVVEQCCHRGASLLLGRVENCGLRCIYHGWLFAPDGKALETPNVADPRFKDRVRQRAYPVREAGGLVWTYLGAADSEPPPFPDMSFMTVPAENRIVVRHVDQANFVQVQEALVDSTHLGFLHQSSVAKLQQAAKPDDDLARRSVLLEDLAPRFETQATEYGFRYAAIRVVPDGQGGTSEVVRVTPWIAPYTILNPAGTIATIVVPMSDTETMFYHVVFSADLPLSQSPYREQVTGNGGVSGEQFERFGLKPQHDPAKPRPSRANRWMQDRESMRNGSSFSGFPDIIVDDAAVSASARPLRSRTIEYLSAADLGVARLYRALLEIADSGKNGTRPTGVDAGESLRGVNGYQVGLAPDEDWKAGTGPADAMRELELDV